MKLLELFKEHLPIIVMDRGIATRINIKLSKNYPRIVIERRLVERDYRRNFNPSGRPLNGSRVFGTPEKVHQEIYRLFEVKDPLKRRHHLAGSRL